MLHKVLILIRYEEQEYENYFHGYLKENSEIIEGFSSAEILPFIRSILSHLPDYRTSDYIDLYLAQSDDSIRCPLKSAFDEMGVRLCENTQWQDEDAYEVLKKLLEFQDKEIVLHGKNKNIGTEDPDSFSISHTLCREYKKEYKKRTSPAAEKEYQQNKEKRTPPSLAELMYRIAERR